MLWGRESFQLYCRSVTRYLKVAVLLCVNEKNSVFLYSLFQNSKNYVMQWLFAMPKTDKMFQHIRHPPHIHYENKGIHCSCSCFCFCTILSFISLLLVVFFLFFNFQNFLQLGCNFDHSPGHEKLLRYVWLCWPVCVNACVCVCVCVNACVCLNPSFLSSYLWTWFS